MKVVLQVILLLCISSLTKAEQSFHRTEAYKLTRRDEISMLVSQINELTSKLEIVEHKIMNIQNHISDLEKIIEVKNLENALQFVNVSNNYEDERKEYDLSLAALKDSDYKLAQEQFKKFIDNNPSSSLLSNAYFWLAESYFRQNDFNKAAKYFLACYSNFPRGIKASDSLLKLAMTFGNLGKKDELCKIIKKLQNEFPDRTINSIRRENEIIEQYHCQVKETK